MSSFVRAQGASTAPAGVRRWVDGAQLVSSGCRGLDSILGGGSGLGTLALLEADWGAAPHASTLAGLWAAQALVSGQQLSVIAPTPARAISFLTSLPRPRTGNGPPGYCETFDLDARVPVDALGATRALHLCRGGPIPVWRVSDVAMVTGVMPACCASVQAPCFKKSCNTLDGAAAAAAAADARVYAELVAAVRSELEASRMRGGAAGVQRLLIIGLCEPTWPSFVAGSGTAPLARALLALRALVQASAPAGGGTGGAVLLVTAALHYLSAPAAERVRAACDVVVKVHAFADPPWALGAAAADASRGGADSGATAVGTAPEFANFQGVLLVRKAARAAAVAGAAAAGDIFCFRRDRRKFAIEPPHLPPEDAGGSGGGGGGGGAASSAVRLGNGSGGGGGSSEDSVAAESDELDALEPSAADIAESTGGRRAAGGLPCASALDF